MLKSDDETPCKEQFLMDCGLSDIVEGGNQYLFLKPYKMKNTLKCLLINISKANVKSSPHIEYPTSSIPGRFQPSKITRIQNGTRNW